MKFGIKNLGPIKEAEIELGNLTIICGKNNCGKTYLVYTLYSLLKFMPKKYVFPAFQHYFDICYKEGFCHFNARDVFICFSQHLNIFIDNFKRFIPSFLAMTQDILSGGTQVSASIEEKELLFFISRPLKGHYQVTEKCTIIVEKEEKSQLIEVRIENIGERLPRKENLRKIFDMICSIFFNAIFPDAFSLTGERSGISIFADNIADFSRKIADMDLPAVRKKRQIKVMESIPEPAFPLPVLKEIEFFQNLKKIRRKQSFLIKDDPQLLQFDDNLFGGRYDFDDQVGVQYFPEKSSIPLTLPECSSSVKSLVEFNFYLRHCAQKQQILMIDEPELNLHPENQRKLARLLAYIANVGVNVLITTHSDYIIREINTMVMLGVCPTVLRESIMADYGYKKEHVLHIDQIKAYELREDGILSEAEIDREVGLTIESMDSTLLEISEIQRKILKG